MHSLLKELSDATENNRPQSSEEFWDKVRKLGTPLVEEIRGEPNHYTVTFLWREQGYTTKDVAVMRNFGNSLYPDGTPCFMERLSGTDIWHLEVRLRGDLRTSYRIFPFDDRNPQLKRENLFDSGGKVWGLAQHDLFNPKAFSNVPENPLMSSLELPNAPEHPWWQQSDTPAGDVTEHQFVSAILGNERQVWVYTPPNFDPSNGPYPVFILFDGDVWGPGMPIQWTLDNLIAAEKVPPMVAIMPHPLNGDIRPKELDCSEEYLDHLVTELLPWAEHHWHITTSGDRTIIGGQSLGGVTSSFAALRMPHRFGNVLSQSGAYQHPINKEFGYSEEHLIQEFVSAPWQPIRFYLEVGLLDTQILPSVRHMRNVLEAKGYNVSYREFHGGHDELPWQGGIADGLISLTRDW